jgi:hypothetical protein
VECYIEKTRSKYNRQKHPQRKVGYLPGVNAKPLCPAFDKGNAQDKRNKEHNTIRVKLKVTHP